MTDKGTQQDKETKRSGMPNDRTAVNHVSRTEKADFRTQAKESGTRYGRKPAGKGKSGYGGRSSASRLGFGNRSRSSQFGKPSGSSGRKEAGKQKPPVEGMPARRLALKVIRQVTEQGAYASLSLNAALENCGLIAADRRLVSRLVYDTLDHLIWIDWVLGQVMAREDTDIKLRNILRLGACQILLEDRIPESAATNTCVQLCTESGMEGLKGVCNGILRNLVRKKDELVFPDPSAEPDKAASVRFSIPEWLWKKLKASYGEAEAERIAGFRMPDEGWTVRPNLTKTDDAGFEQLLKKKVWEAEKTDIPHAWKIRGAMDIARDSDFTGGMFSIMSGSSMMACLAMDVRRGNQILDCCAAPGGKSCYLAELMDGTGRVQAWDVHEHRTALIEAQMKRLGLENIRPMVRDASKKREDLYRTMDAVLLDAPCSGLGVLAEKPDIKLRVTEESISELTEIQKELLDTVCEYVKPGGTLVYSTCSLLPEEDEDQVTGFLSRHPEFEACELPESIPEKYRKYRKNGLQLLEHRDGVEGFYLCRMKRKE